MRLFKFLFVVSLLLLVTGCSSLGLLNAVLPKDAGSRLLAKDIAFGTEPRQRLDVYGPVEDTPGGRHDIIVFTYGGSWASGSRSDYGFAGRAFASRGFITVIADYRLVPDDPYPRFVEDTAAAVAWAYRNAARYGGNPQRIFLVGHSAGAYNAAMVALAPEFLQNQDLEVSVLKGVAGLAGPYDFLPLDPGAAQNAFGHLSPEALRRSQPINRVAASRLLPPSLLMTGDADETVRPRNTQRLAQALEDAGHTAEVKLYADVGHAELVLALSRPLRGRAPVLEDVVTFFRRR